MAKELNPNNRVLAAARDEWHKIAALVMFKCGVTHMDIKDSDVDAFNAKFANIGIADDKGYVEVFLLTEEESAAALKMGCRMDEDGVQDG